MYGKNIKNCVGFSKQSSVLVSFTKFEGIWWYVQNFVSLCILLYDQLRLENAAAFGQGN